MVLKFKIRVLLICSVVIVTLALLSLVHYEHCSTVLDIIHSEQKHQQKQLFRKQQSHPGRSEERKTTEQKLKSKKEGERKRSVDKEEKEEKRSLDKEGEAEEKEERSMDEEHEKSLGEENEKRMDKGNNRQEKSGEKDVRSLDDKANVTRVILLSYMRSGSTFTADLFNQHRDVFYVYEPLWNYDYDFKKGNILTYLDGRPPVSYDKNNRRQQDSLKKDTILSYLSCHFQHVGVLFFAVMKQPWAAIRTKRIQDFLTCWQHVNQTHNLKQCLPLIQKDCDTAKVTVVKTLRFTMTQALTLMESDPHVKVIHLVRDPRGVLNSRKRTGIGQNYHETFQYFCDNVLQDVQDSMTIRKTYPDRVLTIRYEDLASYPLIYTEQLLRFANLDFSPQHRAYVSKITSAKDAGRKDAVVRKESQEKASSWRGQISVSFVKDADEHCAGLYKTMGYLPFPDGEKLKNFTQPSFVGCGDIEVPTLCFN